MNDLDLMELQAETLFCFDERGRMLTTNEPDGQPAPRLFLGRSLDGDVVRFGATVGEDLVRRLKHVIDQEPPASDLADPPAVLDDLREVLSRHAPIGSEWHGPVYRFPEAIDVPGHVVRLTDANRRLVRESFRWLYNDLASAEPAFAVIEDGVAVSVCFSSRNGARAAEAGVDTLADYRGRGHATAVTAAWAVAIRTLGRIPFYSTSWDNVASQGVARRLDLILFGADMSWR